jgi:hypothetical protein
MKTTLASLLLLSGAASAAAQSTVIDYRFDEVKRSVVLVKQKQEIKATPGLKAQSGDKVSTGWFSYALIGTELYRAKFEIFSSTKVELASKEPGVLLTLERGKLRAIFDKITGNEPRVVKTPGALLAVRGTQYTVEVDSSGNTTLDVHEGIVEVRSPLRPEPLLVHAGEGATYGRHAPPVAKPMPRRDGKTPILKPRGGETNRPPSGGDHPQPQPRGGTTTPPQSGPPQHGGHGMLPSTPPAPPPPHS